ncbi:acetyltransferase, gnat family protein [Streptococcus pneumoniae]|nr:acetyltransferase, gnat family protein [Streptococcus pneumoniae]
MVFRLGVNNWGYQFQAPDFYQKHGYKEVFSLQDYLYIRQRYYYQKNL